MLWVQSINLPKFERRMSNALGKRRFCLTFAPWNFEAVCNVILCCVLIDESTVDLSLNPELFKDKLYLYLGKYVFLFSAYFCIPQKGWVIYSYAIEVKLLALNIDKDRHGTSLLVGNLLVTALGEVL